MKWTTSWRSFHHLDYIMSPPLGTVSRFAGVFFFFVASSVKLIVFPFVLDPRRVDFLPSNCFRLLFWRFPFDVPFAGVFFFCGIKCHMYIFYVCSYVYFFILTCFLIVFGLGSLLGAMLCVYMYIKNLENIKKTNQSST